MLIAFIVIGLGMSFGSRIIGSEAGVAATIFSLMSLPGLAFIVWTWTISEDMNNSGPEGFIIAYLGNIVIIPVAMMGYAILVSRILETDSIPDWLEGVLLLTWFGPVVLTVFYWIAAPFVFAFAMKDDYAVQGISGPSDSAIQLLFFIAVVIGGVMWWLNVQFYRKVL